MGRLVKTYRGRTNSFTGVKAEALVRLRAAYVAAKASNAPAALAEPQAVIAVYPARIVYWTEVQEPQGIPVAERTPAAIVEAFRTLGDVDLGSAIARFNAEVVPGLLR